MDSTDALSCSRCRERRLNKDQKCANSGGGYVSVPRTADFFVRHYKSINGLLRVMLKIRTFDRRFLLFQLAKI